MQRKRQTAEQAIAEIRRLQRMLARNEAALLLALLQIPAHEHATTTGIECPHAPTCIRCNPTAFDARIDAIVAETYGAAETAA